MEQNNPHKEGQNKDPLVRVANDHKVDPRLLADLVTLEQSRRRYGIKQTIASRIEDAVEGEPKTEPCDEGVPYPNAGAAEKVRLLRIELLNFSLFRDATLALSHDPSRPIGLIEGGNGHGKSTLIEALRFALYGLSNKQLEASLYRDAEPPEARLKVELTLACSEDGDVLVKRYVDFERVSGRWMKARDPALVLKIEGHEALQDAEAQAWIDARLPEHVFSYFLFDAESSPVSTLATDGPQGNVIGDLEKLLGITPLRTLAKHLEEHRRALYERIEEQEESPTPRQATAQLEQARADLEQRERMLNEVASDLHKTKKDKLGVEKELDQLLKTFDPEQAEARRGQEKQLVRQRAKEEKLVKALEEAVADLPLHLMADHLAFTVRQARGARWDAEQVSRLDGAWEALHRLAKLMEEGALAWSDEPRPPAADIAARLAEAIELEDPSSSKSGSHLSERTITDLELLTQVVLSRPTVGELAERLSEARAQVQALQARLDDQVMALDARQTQLRLGHPDPRQQHVDLMKENDRLAVQLEKQQRRAEELEGQVTEMGGQVDRLGEAVDVAGKTERHVLGLRRQRKLCDRLLACVNELAIKIRSARVTKLEAEATAMFQRITNKPELYKSIKFDRESLRYHLLDHDNRPAPVDRSTGERVVQALAIVHGLLAASERDLPLIVEAPLKPLDEEHTQKALECFYAERGSQVLLLVKPGEIPAHMLSQIEPRIGRRFLIERPDREREVSRLVDIGSN
jgi:DNA sulfur modification protein DndD